MGALKLLVVAFCGLIAAIGLVGMIVPLTLFEFAKIHLTQNALYAVAAVRVTFGALLLLVATNSRMPRVLQVIGALTIIGGILAPIVGVERAQALFSWWAGHGQLLMQVSAALPIALGAFLVYAVSGPRRPAG